MIHADFNSAKEVYYNGQRIRDVYLGAMHIWPRAAAIPKFHWVDALGTQFGLTFPTHWGGNKANIDGLTVALNDGVNTLPLVSHRLLRSVVIAPNVYGMVDDYYIFESLDKLTSLVIVKRRWLSDRVYPNIYLSFQDPIILGGRPVTPVNAPFFLVLAKGN